MIKAVIFDVDGLMIDTELLHSQAHGVVIKNYGKEPIPFTNGLIHIVGKSIKENSKIILEKHNIQETAEVFEVEKGKAYLHLLRNKKIKPLPGLTKLLKLLQKHNIKTAIGSSGIKKGIELILKNLVMEDNFPVIVSLEDIKRPKPFPDVYIKAANLIHVNPKECLVLEDSQSGVEAAKSAGMKIIAIPSKYTKHQDFSKADRIVSSLTEITLPMLQTL